LIINDIENVEYFNIKEMIDKYLDLDEHDKAFLPHSIAEFGDTYGLLRPTLDTKGWFKLTQKGIDLKEYGKGLNKFERKLKRKLSYFEKWSILLIAIGIAFGFYQNDKNQSLESRVSISENQHVQTVRDIDSLNVELLNVKSRLEKLKHQDDVLFVPNQQR
jgi:hypothetical protein